MGYEVTEQISNLLDTDAAGRYVRMSPNSLAVWRSRGEGPKYMKIGRRVYYRVADLDAWMKTRTTHHVPYNSRALI